MGLEVRVCCDMKWPSPPVAFALQDWNMKDHQYCYYRIIIAITTMMTTIAIIIIIIDNLTIVLIIIVTITVTILIAVKHTMAGAGVSFRRSRQKKSSKVLGSMCELKR